MQVSQPLEGLLRGGSPGRRSYLGPKVAADKSPSAATFRLYALSGFLCLWLITICLRLVYLQVFCYGDFEQRAQHQQQRSFDLSPKRGIIFDRAGRELAMSIQVDSAFAVPTEIPDLANTISLIAASPATILASCSPTVAPARRSAGSP